MAEVANHSPQETGINLAPKGQEFIPDPNGMVRVETPHGLITIIIGHTAGEPSAIVFGVDSPIELILGEDNTAESTGALSGLTRHPLGRIAAGITLAAGAVVGAGGALSACTPNSDSPNNPAGIYGTHQSALAMDQILNVGPGQEIPWSEPGDIRSNYGEMNGKKYIFVGRNNSVAYVECQAIADCLEANVGQVKTVQGLFEAGMGGSYGGSGVFQDQAGNNKAIITPGNKWPQKCDITENANQTLEVSNCAETELPIDASPSIFLKDGIPHALWASGSKVRDGNLHTNVTINTPASGEWGSSCGPGFEAGNIVVASQKQVIQGVTHCRLVTAATWAELVAGPIALNSLNNGPNGSKILRHARLANGNILIYAREPAGAPDKEKLWYALIPDLPQNPEPDAGAPDAGQPIPDVNQPDTGPEVPPIKDAGPAPDAQPDPGDVAGEVADATADAADAAAVIPPEDVTPDSGPDLPPAVDAGPDLPPPPDAQVEPDTQTPDIQNPACDFAKLKLTIEPGCQLENCIDPSVDIIGECTFYVYLGKANPVVIELNGKYRIDLLEKIGAHFSGEYQVVDNGNGFNTVAGSFGTGVEGTIYSGKFMVGSKYLLSCQKGTIKVFLIKANREKELLATLDAGESQIFDMNNPQPEPSPEPTQDAGQPQPEPTPDAGQPNPEPAKDAGQPQPEPATDAGSPQPEPETPSVTSKPPSNDGGCSTTGITKENPNLTGHLATLALALMALGAATRRKQEQQALKPASILTRTWNRVSRSLGLRR